MITWEGELTFVHTAMIARGPKSKIHDSVFTYGLQNGGPAGLVYGFLFSWLGYFFVLASMAELVSM